MSDARELSETEQIEDFEPTRTPEEIRDELEELEETRGFAEKPDYFVGKIHALWWVIEGTND